MNGDYNQFLEFYSSQYFHGQVITIWMLGNWFALGLQTPVSHDSYLQLSCWLPQKINAEAKKESCKLLTKSSPSMYFPPAPLYYISPCIPPCCIFKHSPTHATSLMHYHIPSPYGFSYVPPHKSSQCFSLIPLHI